MELKSPDFWYTKLVGGMFRISNYVSDIKMKNEMTESVINDNL